jgi:hypothetical protein
MRFALSLLAAMPLAAAWNYNVISGATNGAIASRTLGGVESTYVAYRDAAGSLGVSRLIGNTLWPQTIWVGANPSRTFINVSSTGTILVTFWSGGRFRFAVSTGPGVGNCGPGNDWQCGDVLLPGSVTGTEIEQVVGDVDGISRAHFLYALRPNNLTRVQPGLYSVSRSVYGYWSTPVRAYDSSEWSPTGFVVSSSATTYGTFTAYQSSGGAVTGTVVGTGVSNVLNIPGSNSATYAAMDPHGLGPAAYCKAGPSVELIRRMQNGAWGAVYPITSTPVATCAVVLRPTSNTPVVAYPSAQGTIEIAWKTNWSGSLATETVDASAVFSKPQMVRNGAAKLYVLYDGNGFLKLAREQ